MEKSVEVSRVSESRTLSFSPFRIDFFFCTIVSLDRVAFNRKIFRIFDTYCLRFIIEKNTMKRVSLNLSQQRYLVEYLLF